MVQNSDIVYSATQHIDRLMRRVVLLMFGAGVLAVLAIWHMEANDGTIDLVDRVSDGAFPRAALPLCGLAENAGATLRSRLSLLLGAGPPADATYRPRRRR